jgi:hypothetical protein
MNPNAEILELIESYRDRCLWFLRPDYVPATVPDMLRVLDLIERYGDRKGFERAEKLKQWLQRDSSARS